MSNLFRIWQKSIGKFIPYDLTLENKDVKGDDFARNDSIFHFDTLGNEIFEEDIVEVSNGRRFLVGARNSLQKQSNYILLDGAIGFYFEDLLNKRRYFMYANDKKDRQLKFTKVIGNTWENPELLWN